MTKLSGGLVVRTRELLEEARAALSEACVRVVFEQPAACSEAVLTALVDRHHPDLVLIEMAAVQGSLQQSFAALLALPVPPAIVGLDRTPDPELIVAAMRAGACEFLYPPVRAKLTAVLERISASAADNQRASSGRGKVLGFASAKGGCGATTIACHLAVALQRVRQDKILLSDFDLESGIVRFLMKAKSAYSLLDAAMNVHRLDLNFWAALVSNGLPRLEVITAPQHAPAEVPPLEAFQYVLRFARRHYDWVLADLGRGVTSLSMTLLEEIDQTFLVTTLDVPALFQAKQVITRLLETGYARNRLNVVLNRGNKNADVTLGELDRMLGLPVYFVVPNDYASLYEAYAGGKLLGSDSPAGKQFARLAARIAGVPEQKAKSRFSLLG